MTLTRFAILADSWQSRFSYCPYNDIIKTYVKALQWINQNNYKVSGPVSEEFIISPVDVKDENEHVTKILIPVNKE